MKIDFKTGTFYHGDCFEVMAELASGSADLVLNDPPYGTTQNKWDAVIPFEPMWEAYWRLLKSNGAAVLTAQCPFDKALGASQLQFLKYEWIWEKTEATGHLNAKKQPMKCHETALTFYREQCVYNPQKVKGAQRKVTQRSANGSANYGSQTPTVYDSDERYPRSVLHIPKDDKNAKIHPTQKPVALFEYLIRTYTNPGELVLDNTAGSGTTAIAAMQSGRRWICIERDWDYFAKAVARVMDAEEKL